MSEVIEHINSLGLAPPRSNQQVFKDDCSYCFDTPDAEFGLDLCLQCFLASCPDPKKNHTAFHRELTGHDVFLNIKRTPKAKQQKTPKLAKLAIEADKEEDHYDTATSVRDLKFGGSTIEVTHESVANVVEGVLRATSYARREEIQAWEQEITPCCHILGLTQDEATVLQSQNLAHCALCDLQENLWLCLTCGNLGCGRAQFGGVGGNSHGLTHFDSCGHPASVKLGSITPEGGADVYCYRCNEEVQDPAIAAHLNHFGINIADRVQTEKSLTELQIEQNLKWDFSMVTDDGKLLQPLFGPGLTGIKNLGNSCYMSSVVQCLFSLPQFIERYSKNSELPVADPANDLEVQMRKLADGVLSGRYAVPSNDTESDVQHQKGIALGMFKALIGRGHVEFSTMRQQDAFEFLTYLSEKLSQSSRKSNLGDPTTAFKFESERRIQCNNCNQVMYKTESQENLSIPVPARKVEGSEGEYEPVKLKECIDLYTAREHIDYKCSNCQATDSEVDVKFKSFPEVLVLNARRFQIVNWVPTKLDIPVEVDDSVFPLDEYLSKGPQPDEELMEDSGEEDGKFVANEMLLEQLESMGMPKVRAEKALFATGNSDAEIAMNWLLEHMEDPDIDSPVLVKSQKSSGAEPDAGQVSMIMDMGFTQPQAKKALSQTGGNVEAAVEWLFSNPDDSGAMEEDEPESEEAGPVGDSSLPANYRLKGIICHKGASIHAGHYVAFVRKEIDGQDEWVLFNDEKVVRGGEIEEMKKFAYVYLFERVR
ncbi:ubiquitin carboxyl-terminal hydrolase 14 [Trichomonascus vanleenenianus]|uniref:ubiquitin carboxyl-terminal hydrolase 14 n=1 Tax=Trichomonascus vanleenenianus TaxID=2268995 RepID=UPI003ECB59B2